MEFLKRDIPGLAGDLDSVQLKALELAHDPLGRQPLTSVVESALGDGGKLIRPILVLLSGRLGPGWPGCSAALKDAAAIIELTHTASLIHDDIVDDAPLRRGRPSVQSAYGKDMAVYAGDFLLSKVLGALMQPGMSDVGPVLSRSMADMCSGEMTQYAAQFDTKADESSYFISISGKTASLFSAACEAGAILSGCTREVTSGMCRFGHALGILFQLRDDLMDCTDADAGAGKCLGMDFIRGVYTLPVLYSFLEPGYGPRLKELSRSAASGEAGENLSAELMHLVTAAGGAAYTRWTMRQYHERAKTELGQLPEGPIADALLRMASALLEE